MENKAENKVNESGEQLEEIYDFNNVNSVARIALYDDLLSAPRVTEVQPAPTEEFIQNLSNNVYEQAKNAGGTIPYTVIREVTENFIHARFKEATVSILDGGNTIRFSDQGPGIPFKEKVQLPGFTSATEPMKRYIRGVGSGLPIVKEYLDYSGGTISIEDNLGTGSVVTISSIPEEPEAIEEENYDLFTPNQTVIQGMYSQQGQQGIPPYGTYPVNPMVQNGYIAQNQAAYQMPYAQGVTPQGMPVIPGQQIQPHYQMMPQQQYQTQPFNPATNQVSQAAQNASVLPLISTLSDRERNVFSLFKTSHELGVTEISNALNLPSSSVHTLLGKLEQAGLITETNKRKRKLTAIGTQLINSI